MGRQLESCIPGALGQTAARQLEWTTNQTFRHQGIVIVNYTNCSRVRCLSSATFEGKFESRLSGHGPEASLIGRMNQRQLPGT